MTLKIGQLVITSTLLLLLAGCSTTHSTPSAEHSPPSKITQYQKSIETTIETTEDKTPSKVKFIREKKVSSSSNRCIDDMQLLKQTQPQAYSQLSMKYHKLLDEFRFLQRNEEIMDKETQSYLSDILNMKLEVLCSKIKYDAFLSVKQKAAQLYNI